MLRTFTLAALLLVTLMWAISVFDATEDAHTPVDSIHESPSTGEPLPTSFPTEEPSPTPFPTPARPPLTSTTIITVTTTNDEVIIDDGACSLREAIQAVNTNNHVDACSSGSNANTVFLPAGQYDLALGQLDLTGTVTLHGSTTGSTVLNGSGGSRIFYIAQNADVELWYLSIQNGGPTTEYCGNESAAGGGIFNDGTTLIAHSIIYNNSAGSQLCVYSAMHGEPGGGIFNTGTMTIVNSTISGNTSGDGMNDMVRNDIACGTSGEGGGIANHGSLALHSSTVTSNKIGKIIAMGFPCTDKDYKGKVGGIYNTADIYIENSIIANNERSDCGGAVNSLGNNLFQDIAACIISGLFVHAAAQLGPLQGNGGPTLTHALEQNSPAINAGDCLDSTGITVTVDQRGEPRPQRGECDLGAFESPYTATVTIPPTTQPLVRLPLISQSEIAPEHAHENDFTDSASPIR